MISVGKRSSARVVGLDVQPGYVAAAEVTDEDGLRLRRVGVVDLDAGVVRDGEVVDVDGLTSALRTLFAENGLPRRARVGVANQRVVIRTVDLPPLEGSELDAAIRFQASDLIPMPMDQAVLDYHSLGVVDTPDGRRTRVVLVAARREMVMRLVEALRGAGVRPAGVDVSAFAMVRTMRDTGASEDETVLLVHVGGLTNLSVARAGVCLFGRALPVGLESMAGALAERRGLTLTHARQWLSYVGLEQPVETIDGETEIVTEARRVLAEGTRTIADDVRTSLDYFRLGRPDASVTSIRLLGPGCEIPGLAGQLSAELSLPVQPAPALDAVAELSGRGDLARFGLAAGLAVEERAA